MNKKKFYSGIGFILLGVIFTLLNMTKIETSFGETFLGSVKIYPAAFLSLLGVLLIFYGLMPLRRN